MSAYALIGWAWLVTLTIWIAASFSNKRTVRKQPARARAVQIFLGIVAGLLIWGRGPMEEVSGPVIIPSTPVWKVVAIGLTLLGVALALWSRFVLGRNWSATVTVKQQHELKRSGPYGIVRHPIYSGFLVALLGTAIARGTVAALVGVVVVLVVFRLKANMEEQFMLEQFGSEYGEYRARVKGLIPFVW